MPDPSKVVREGEGTLLTIARKAIVIISLLGWSDTPVEVATKPSNIDNTSYVKW